MKAEYETALYGMADDGRPECGWQLTDACGGVVDVFSDNRRLIQRNLLRLHPLIQRAFADLFNFMKDVTLDLNFLHG